MRTLTVKETASLLGVSVRTIQNRLNTGELSGKRVTNQYGTQEWRVWPNKEIIERSQGALALGEMDTSRPAEEFQGGDSSAVVEAEMTEEYAQSYDDDRVAKVIREMTREFANQLQSEKATQYQLLRELEEKERQLKLLPDFERQAEERELKAVALQKQIEAIETDRHVEIQMQNQKAQQLEEQLAEAEKEKAALAVKANEATALASDLAVLKSKVEEMQKPWWKKLFGQPES